MQTVHLDKRIHNRTRFDCKVEPLNNYLRLMAGQQSKRDNVRTFILEDHNNPAHIVGFYSLTMIALDLSSLPDGLRKKHHNAGTAGLIARLAVDKRYQGRRFGEWLMVDALLRLLHATDSVAFPLVIVDTKDGAAPFYQKFGFTPFPTLKNRLFMTIADVRLNLGTI
ncbi:MAG TPA: GNAT family N-acetyltransferase [Desulfomicrobiaceae bacterium]|nr:GNAT family N-acetyltransferase [Desulfomicrobiaceae bacterium]